ncbi:MAG TPA: SDR family oxidoreductase [Puia sp.]|jgi:NAD(P)-dependent dehydrogenase (short-subunit alcohol dehydrogenase family)
MALFFNLFQKINMATSKKTVPEQKQSLPGSEQEMDPKPVSDDPEYKPTGKLKDKVVLITGGESGIGKAVAILFAKEEAKLAIVYLKEDEDAADTRKQIEKYGGRALFIRGDISDAGFCREQVLACIREYGGIDILVNNAAVQHPVKKLEDLKDEDLLHTFQVNILSMFRITREALPYMKKGSCIINTTSVTAYHGSAGLLDYSSTKGAIVSFTRSLALNLAEREIRVNGVAPGPVWTPLIPASFEAGKTSRHGSDVPMKRPGQPVEIAPSYLFLATGASSYMSGQILHPNGGTIVNG